MNKVAAYTYNNIWFRAQSGSWDCLGLSANIFEDNIHLSGNFKNTQSERLGYDYQAAPKSK